MVRKGDAVFHTLFTYKLRQVVIFGNVEITQWALVQLMRNNIDTVFMSYDGRYLGRIAAPESRNEKPGKPGEAWGLLLTFLLLWIHKSQE